jgi:hypothetical protein
MTIVHREAARKAFETIRFFGPAESAFSIGYKGAQARQRGGVRYITDLDLFEVSPVLHDPGLPKGGDQ